MAPGIGALFGTAMVAWTATKGYDEWSTASTDLLLTMTTQQEMVASEMTCASEECAMPAAATEKPLASAATESPGTSPKWKAETGYEKLQKAAMIIAFFFLELAFLGGACYHLKIPKHSRFRSRQDVTYTKGGHETSTRSPFSSLDQLGCLEPSSKPECKGDIEVLSPTRELGCLSPTLQPECKGDIEVLSPTADLGCLSPTLQPECTGDIEVLSPTIELGCLSPTLKPECSGDAEIPDTSGAQAPAVHFGATTLKGADSDQSYKQNPVLEVASPVRRRHATQAPLCMNIAHP